jgi:hypothetical protein
MIQMNESGGQRRFKSGEFQAFHSAGGRWPVRFTASPAFSLREAI